jgi:hypothetical protein
MTTQQRHASSDGATSSDYGAAAVRPRDVRRRAKPGPKGWLKNPRPVEWTDDEGRAGAWPTEVAAHELDDAEQRLRAYFVKRRDELTPRPRETTTAPSRITRIAADALSATNAVWWSGYAVESEITNPAAFRQAASPSEGPPHVQTFPTVESTRAASSLSTLWARRRPATFWTRATPKGGAQVPLG